LSGVNHSRTNVATAKAFWSTSTLVFRFRVSGFEFCSGFVFRFSVLDLVLGLGFSGFGFRFSVFWFSDWSCLGSMWLCKTCLRAFVGLGVSGSEFGVSEFGVSGAGFEQSGEAGALNSSR